MIFAIGYITGVSFCQVSVGAHIFPQNPVIHTGNLLNFSITGADNEVTGQWFTSNRSVISVNVASGQAKAISQGSTHGNINLSFRAFSGASVGF
jgi:nuclear pore complex protein Nup210